jgi:hypothetical protein
MGDLILGRHLDTGGGDPAVPCIEPHVNVVFRDAFLIGDSSFLSVRFRVHLENLDGIIANLPVPLIKHHLRSVIQFLSGA